MDKYINREISWLSFNRRVLQEAADHDVPLIERLKFLGIFSNNLDEFYRVRVGSLIRMQNAGIRSKAIFGGSPKKILGEIKEIALEDRDTFDKTFRNLEKELNEKDIFIINEKELTEQQSQFVHDYFSRAVRPRLVPIMLDPEKKFPYLRNQVIYLAIYLVKQSEPDHPQYALIEVPADIIPRFIVLPKVDEKCYVIMLDDVIRHELKDIFAIFNFDRIEAYTIKLTRDAEIDIEEDITKSFFEKISKSIKQRQRGKPVRFVLYS
jgi:polyphosphate kinase